MNRGLGLGMYERGLAHELHSVSQREYKTSERELSSWFAGGGFPNSAQAVKIQLGIRSIVS